VLTYNTRRVLGLKTSNRHRNFVPRLLCIEYH